MLVYIEGLLTSGAPEKELTGKERCPDAQAALRAPVQPLWEDGNQECPSHSERAPRSTAVWSL